MLDHDPKKRPFARKLRKMYDEFKKAEKKKDDSLSTLNFSPNDQEEHFGNKENRQLNNIKQY